MRRRALLVLALNLVAAVVYAAVGWSSGLLQHVTTDTSGFYSIFSSNDSLEYHAVANWIFGAPLPASAEWRPFLFPLLLGTAERLGGLTGIWLLNVALWAATLNLTAAAAFRFVQNRWASSLVFLALAIDGSLIALTFKGLTEITTIALLAIWMFGVARLTMRPTPAQVAWTLLPVSLLTVVKPEFEALLVVVVIVLVVGIVKSTVRLAPAISLFACLVPVAVQVGLMIHSFAYFGISTIGGRTLRSYYLPRVADPSVGSGFDAARVQFASMSDGELARYVLGHLGPSISTFAISLKENMLADSGFLLGHAKLEDAILLSQRIYLVMAIALIPLAFLALSRRRDGRFALICLGALTIYAAGGLTFSQSDRIMSVVVPPLLVAFVTALDQSGAVRLWRAMVERFGGATSVAPVDG